MNKFKKINKLSEFKKDFKQLKKKYKTLSEDLNNLINHSLYAYHKLQLDNKGIFPIPGLKLNCDIIIYKVKKFSCKSLKGSGANSGLRLIYTYHQESDYLELIELYYKGHKATENKRRILKYFQKK